MKNSAYLEERIYLLGQNSYIKEILNGNSQDRINSPFMPVEGDILELNDDIKTHNMGDFEGLPFPGNNLSLFMPVDGNTFDQKAAVAPRETSVFEGFPFPDRHVSIFMPVDGNRFNRETDIGTYEMNALEDQPFPDGHIDIFMPVDGNTFNRKADADNRIPEGSVISLPAEDDFIFRHSCI
ncbi:hypothetical protein BFW38_03660 [Terasakiispira papahanaumokuakeensis]|uniref:Uncharacterized protein n=1 Tax=Terasakiispira papahanaumokuakeensis TaxID=197479 RepID=A0A1E2V781_9GAMM|nr:hypothetical protein [Terasakiispira papahanaumokuakeensis]ODC02773.1 hypothetical protein BFW38_03660 [Terasakiispira papahanaumokuakeensis]